MGVVQRPVDARSGRFRARTDALSGPEHPGDGLGKFHFRLKIQDLGVIFPWFGGTAARPQLAAFNSRHALSVRRRTPRGDLLELSGPPVV